ncbi:hypothetical protein VP01_8021g1, partial [Puccinia sorghi]
PWCLRDIQFPRSYPQDICNNVVLQLGTFHTLWNISQKRLTNHLGDTLKKAIQKKYFTTMLKHMQKFNDAKLFFCFRQAY